MSMEECSINGCHNIQNIQNIHFSGFGVYAPFSSFLFNTFFSVMNIIIG
jgi:hypothetical protein